MGGPTGLAGASMSTKVVPGLVHLVAAVSITLGPMRGPVRVS